MRTALVAAATVGAGALAGPRANAAPQQRKRPKAHRFYVATNGNDSWSGDQAKRKPGKRKGPFRTLHRARDAARALRAAGGLSKPVEIVVAAGTYYLSEPLIFTPQDSGTKRSPTRWIADGDVVISGGRPIEGEWTLAGGIASTVVDDPWPFRSLFVDGRRQTLARFPNADPHDVGRSYLYNGGQDAAVIMSGLANEGDFVEHGFTVDTAGGYDLWLGVATVETGIEDYIEISVDGVPLPLGQIEGSGGYRVIRFSRAVTGVELTAGEHLLRVTSTADPERRVHLHAVVFTTDSAVVLAGPDLPAIATGERRVVVNLHQRSTMTGYFSSIGLNWWAGANVPGGTSRLRADAELVKASWASDPQARVEVIPELHYLSTSCELVAVDESTGVIDIAQTSQPLSLMPSNHFFVAGVREELDQAGEWYHDPTTGLLELIPEDGVDPNSVEIVAPALEHVIVFEGDPIGGGLVQWIELSGFSIRHSTAVSNYASVRSPTDAAVKLDCAQRCTIENCTIESVDGYGLWLHLDSCDNVVQHNEFRDLGIGGVLLTAAVLDYGIVYDDRPEVQELAALRNLFAFNHIHHGGRVRLQAAGFNLGSRPASTALEAGNTFIGNHVHDMTRQGIFAFRNQGGHIVAYNLIEDVVLQTADAGAINFAIMTNLAAPNLVRNNTVRNADGLFRLNESTSKPEGFGLYADHSSSHSVWAQNTVSDTLYPTFIHGGQFTAVLDNVLADPGQLWAQDLDRIMMRNRARRNVVANERRVEDRPLSISNPPPEMAAKISEAPWLSYDINRNLIHHPEDDPLVWFGRLSDWQAGGNDTLSLRGDPRFRNPGARDYGLRPGSPARRLPIARFDPQNTGTRARTKGDLRLEKMTTLSAVSERSLSEDGRTATYDVAVPAPGLYRVYGRRAAPGSAPQHVLVTVEHADGQTRHAFDELVGPGRNPVERFGIYLGTFEFRARGTVTFFQPAGAAMWTPDDVILLRVPRLDVDATGEVWESGLTLSKAKLRPGARTRADVWYVSVEGLRMPKAPGRTRIVSDNPAAVTVTSSGMVRAVAPGLARLRAITESSTDIVRSDEILVTVGDVLWSAELGIGNDLIGVGETTTLSVSAWLDTGASLEPDSSEVTYESLSPAIASVDAEGVVTGVTEGTAVIVGRVTRSGVEVSASLEARVAASVSPVLRYAFDELGPVADTADLGAEPLSPGVFHGTATRSSATPMSAGSSLDLTDSGTAYVTPGPTGSAKLDGLGRFSICTWLRLEQDPAQFDRIFGRGEAVEWVVNGATRDAVSTYVRLGTAFLNLPPLDLSSWTFFAMVGTGARVIVYAGTEGTAAAEIGSLATTQGLASAPGVELRIGGTSLTTADRTPPALIDEYRVYAIDLPPSVLEEIRNEGR